MHEIMENTLGLLYTCPRGLFRRRRWKLGVTVRNFFFMVKFPEFLGSPIYMIWLGIKIQMTTEIKINKIAVGKKKFLLIEC
jgi:hypothetical protein